MIAMWKCYYIRVRRLEVNCLEGGFDNALWMGASSELILYALRFIVILKVDEVSEGIVRCSRNGDGTGLSLSIRPMYYR